MIINVNQLKKQANWVEEKSSGKSEQLEDEPAGIIDLLEVIIRAFETGAEEITFKLKRVR